MDERLIFLAVVVGLTFILAGFVKGVIGLGLPTVAIGLLGLVMTPAQAVALLVVPSLVTNLWQLAAGPGLLALLQRLWPMLLGICAGTAGGAALGLHADEHANTLLGVALIAYAVFGLSKKRFTVSARAEDGLAPLIGACTGLVTAATGVFVLPAVPYLQALDLGKNELVQALGLSFTVSTLAMALALFGHGSFHFQAAGLSLAALAPALVGMFLGQWVRTRVRAETFRLCFFAGLLLLGTHLALKSFL
jgi:uncharacterized membrane protein YfcA